ncbi:putative opaque-phase-specific protein OP4 [[Candida] railenensis]|uniref:Opaque-phase-specific protein OP4 n=1 Tax=[Candida] railenensis TaxID=45579 RepID=A0A9P0QLG7_9ASCO|nr:putative opaque-phase-specific protein OP4 [[Candida] railenensis]
MKFTTASITALIALSAAVEASPIASNSGSRSVAVLKREHIDSMQALVDELNSLQVQKYKRNIIERNLSKGELSTREYEIVTEVLSLLNDSGIAPQVIHYFATNPTFQPIVIKTIVAVVNSGLLDINFLFKVLNESGLIVQTIQDLISDCSLYATLFNYVGGIVKDLASNVESLISGGITQLISRDVETRYMDSNQYMESQMMARDLDSIVVNLLESLSQSGLATSVIKSIITDPSYLPFGIDLVKAVLQNNSLDLGSLLTALKNSGLVESLMDQFLNFGTLQTVITNAFAAFSGKCSSYSGSSSSGSGSSVGSSSGSSSSSGASTGSSSGSSGSGTVTTGTGGKTCCKRKKKRSNKANKVKRNFKTFMY